MTWEHVKDRLVNVIEPSVESCALPNLKTKILFNNWTKIVRAEKLERLDRLRAAREELTCSFVTTTIKTNAVQQEYLPQLVCVNKHLFVNNCK